jgi:amino acid adenylation domain-containing protein
MPVERAALPLQSPGAAGLRGDTGLNSDRRELFRPLALADIEQSIGQRFASQCALYPGRPAVSADGDSITYAELDRRSTAAAMGLLGAGPAGGTAVGVLLPQGIDLVVAILGVLKAGHLYVGLDCAAPSQRLARLAAIAGLQCIVTDGEHEALAEQIAPGAVVHLVGDPGVGTAAKPLPQVDAGAPAYIFFTSGTTGEPKGVVDCHRNVLHNVLRYTNSLQLGCDDRLTLLQNASFSGAVSSLFGALLNGACCCPLEVGAHAPGGIAEWIGREQITVYHSVPALFRAVFAAPGDFSSIRVVRLEGDQAARRDAELFTARCAPAARLVNGLGTTETGLVSQLFLAPGDIPHETWLPVGWPVQGMAVTILDEAQQPVAVGGLGEIAVRSRYLASGYWQDPQRTAQRFRPDPGDVEGRLYLTGDMGRIRPDGCLEHLGRCDGQLRLNGRTVLLPEVERALLETPGVREAAAGLRAGTADTPRLVAWVVPQRMPGPAPDALRESLAARLPAHMVPAAYVTVERLPLSQNGKLDRAALPAPGIDRPALRTPYKQSRNLLEYQLCQLVAGLLGIRPIGVDDDLLDLGADSVMALRLLAEIKGELGVDLAPQRLAGASTVAGLARIIRDEACAAVDAVVNVQQGSGEVRLFYLHGDYLSGGYYCVRLARCIGPAVTFCAVTPCGLDDLPLPSRLEDMAARHAAAIRAVQASGPYYLGGTCNGGLLAYEVARRLRDAGEEVALVALFYAAVDNLRFAWLSDAMDRLATSLNMSAAGRDRAFDMGREVVLEWERAGVAGVVARIWRRLSQRRARESALPRAEPPVRVPGPAGADLGARLRRHYLALDRLYVPKPGDLPVTLLWPSGESCDAETMARPWRRLSPAVEIIELSSSHHDSLTAEADVLGAGLARAIERARGRHRAALDPL